MTIVDLPPAIRAAAANAINLAYNESPFGFAPACWNVLYNVQAADLIEYPPNFRAGRPSELAEHLARHCQVEPNQVLLGYGAEQLLDDAVTHHVHPGDTVLAPSVSWPYYWRLFDDTGATVRPYLVEPDGDEHTVDVDGLLTRSGDAALVLLASPNNPTGSLFPFDRIAEVAAAHPDAVVVLDEAYHGLGDLPPDPTRYTALLDDAPNLLIVRTFSKLYGLAGARIGYALRGARLARYAARRARYLGYNRLSELLGIAALDSTSYYDDVRRAMVAGRALLTSRLRAAGVQVYGSQANFVLARWPGAGEAAVARDQLARAGITVKWPTEPELTHCARITVGTPGQNLALLDALTAPPLARAPRRLRRADLIPAYQLAELAGA